MKPSITPMTLQREIHLVPPPNKGLNFDRNQILNKYWDLADLGPETTKGNILGQLKALDSLCEEMAEADKPNTPANRAAKRPFYRSQWMPDA
jgi:hypothetical protein